MITALQPVLQFAGGSPKKRRPRKPPRLVRIKHARVLQDHDGSRFLGGSACESAFFRQAPQLDATAKLLLERNPLSDKTPIPIRVYGCGDREIPGLIFSLLRRVLHNDKDYQALRQSKDKRKIKSHEKMVLHMLGDKFPIVGIDANPWILARSERGAIQTFYRDKEWIKNANKIPDLSISLTGLLKRHTRFLRSKKEPLRNGVFELSKLVRRACGESRMGRYEDDLAQIPHGAGLVMARNVVAYQVRNLGGKYGGENIQHFVNQVVPKLLENGLVLLGPCEVGTNNDAVTDPLFRSLAGNNMSPVLPDACPMLSPIGPLAEANTFAPCLFEKSRVDDSHPMLLTRL